MAGRRLRRRQGDESRPATFLRRARGGQAAPHQPQVAARRGARAAVTSSPSRYKHESACAHQTCKAGRPRAQTCNMGHVSLGSKANAQGRLQVAAATRRRGARLRRPGGSRLCRRRVRGPRAPTGPARGRRSSYGASILTDGHVPARTVLDRGKVPAQCLLAAGSG